MCIDDGIFACRVFHSQAEDIGFSPLSLGTQSLIEYIFLTNLLIVPKKIQMTNHRPV